MVRAAVIKVGDLAGEGVLTNKAKGEKMAMEPTMNSALRRKLGDITNLLNQKANQQQQSSTEYADNLQKENMKLTKVLMERNKIIELNGSALQKLRINFQKVQEQNLLLAQTNTRLLTEINTSKDQLKVLQHELSCKNGVLMARKLVLEEQNLPRTHCHTSEDKDRADSPGEACESFEKANNKRRVSRRKNPANCEDVIGIPGESIETTNIRSLLRRQSAKFNIHGLGVTENLNDDQQTIADAGCSTNDQSIGSNPEAVKPHDTKEITGKSRVSTRRHSTKVKPQEAIKESADSPLHDDIVEESSKISSSVSLELKRESKKPPSGDEAEEMRKPSVSGRPSRQAAGKIKSYKEASLKEKMRRSF